MLVADAIEVGLAHHRAGRFADAEAVYREVLRRSPDNPAALNLLGALAHQLGQNDVAVELIGRAIALNPHVADFHNNLGAALRARGDFAAAVDALNTALALNPRDDSAPANLSAALTQLARYGEAIATAQAAIARGCTNPALMRNFATALTFQGRVEEAIGWLDRAVDAESAISLARTRLAWRLYVPARNQDGCLLDRLRFGQLCAHSDDALAVPMHTDRDPDRRLRIGLVSSDLHDHPVARTIRHWFAEFDRRELDLTAYAEVQRPDDATRWFQAHCERWCSTVGMTDRAMAEQIRTDRIDILVIIAGHFDDNRLSIGGWRAAPVQITYDVASSGQAAMDYALTDPVLDPPGTTERWTEHRLHMPSFHVYEVPGAAPDIGPVPQGRRQQVTFGSFNNPMKTGPAVVALWSRVLQRVPTARLVMKCSDRFADRSICDRYLGLFAEHGIDAARIEFRGPTPGLMNHLAEYNDIDVALDSFPFTGATTTFEALWMGVPVVTLAGERLIQRMSASMLRSAKLERCIAETPDDFVTIAAQLAANLGERQTLRAELRERVRTSPLCDGTGQVRTLEKHFRQVWQARCAADRRGQVVS